MITEILGALIVLGAALVLIMRHFLSKGKAKEKESVEVSASRLRYEIERSGDAVIGRMQIHVERLERLLAEANAQKAALDERLAALAQWEKVYGAQLGAADGVCCCTARCTGASSRRGTSRSCVGGGAANCTARSFRRGGWICSGSSTRCPRRRISFEFSNGAYGTHAGGSRWFLDRSAASS